MSWSIGASWGSRSGLGTSAWSGCRDTACLGSGDLQSVQDLKLQPHPDQDPGSLSLSEVWEPQPVQDLGSFSPFRIHGASARLGSRDMPETSSPFGVCGDPEIPPAPLVGQNSRSPLAGCQWKQALRDNHTALDAAVPEPEPGWLGREVSMELPAGAGEAFPKLFHQTLGAGERRKDTMRSPRSFSSPG